MHDRNKAGPGIKCNFVLKSHRTFESNLIHPGGFMPRKVLSNLKVP